MTFSALFMHIFTFIDDLVIPTQVDSCLTVEMLTFGSPTAGPFDTKSKRMRAAVGESGVPSQNESVIMRNFNTIQINFINWKENTKLFQWSIDTIEDLYLCRIKLLLLSLFIISDFKIRLTYATKSLRHLNSEASLNPLST